MDELPGWKPFRNVDPSMTETSLDDAVQALEKWLRDVQKLKEGVGYLKKAAGAWTSFYVREERFNDLVEAYATQVLNQAGGEAAFNEKNAFKYPQSHRRGLGK